MLKLISGALLAAVFLAGAATAEAAVPRRPAATAPVPAPAPAPPLTSADMLRQAEASAAAGDVLGATQLYQSAIIFAPTDPLPYIALAQFHAMNAEPDLGEKYYLIALELDPANARALAGMALLSLASGDRAGAQARHDLLVRACGPMCPETIQVAQALGAAPGRTN
jgi:Flp pilus assembly protein TadD